VAGTKACRLHATGASAYLGLNDPQEATDKLINNMKGLQTRLMAYLKPHYSKKYRYFQ